MAYRYHLISVGNRPLSIAVADWAEAACPISEIYTNDRGGDLRPSCYQVADCQHVPARMIRLLMAHEDYDDWGYDSFDEMIANCRIKEIKEKDIKKYLAKH